MPLFREAIDFLTGDLLRERLGQAMPPSLYARNMATFCLADLGEFGEATRLGREHSVRPLPADDAARRHPAEEIAEGMRRGRYLSAQEALTYRFIDEISAAA